MKLAMDKVSFMRRGTEVHTYKGPAREAGGELQSGKCIGKPRQSTIPSMRLFVVGMDGNLVVGQHRQGA